MMDLSYIKKNQILVNKWIKDYFRSIKKTTSLDKAIQYGVANGGKRLRPYFLIQLSKILKIPISSYKQLALAVEFIHCYSLIHDDLPAMDNDDFRRGKITVHKKFNESTAILAGNSLYGIAMELILDKKIHRDSEIKLKILKILLDYSGLNGLMKGQFYDLYHENKNPSTNKILLTYQLKTSKLFQLSTTLPFVLKSEGNKYINYAQTYGRNFGIIYQIADDFSDSDKTFKETGKVPGKDKKKGKQTLVAKIGREKALKLCHKLADEATENIPIFGDSKYNFKKLIFNIFQNIKKSN